VARTLTIAALLALAASPGVHAQTNDHVFRSWQWTFEPAAPRAAGLAGATTAVADDASAALYNPAGLVSLVKAEVALGLLSRRAGQTAQDDALSARTSGAYVAAAGRLGSRWAFAGYAAEPLARRVRLATPPLPDGLADDGSIEAVVSEAGLAAAWRATSYLSLGGRVAASRLSLDGEYSREPAAGLANLRVTTTGRATRAIVCLGVVLEPLPRLRLAVASLSGARWRVTRTATSPVLGVVLDEGSPYEVRQPRLLSAGVALQVSRKLLLTAQLDRVSYHDLQAGLVIGQGAHARAEYALADAWEPRAGIELSLPRKAVSLQLRGGVHWQSVAALRYTGEDPVEAAAFEGAPRKAVGAAGASVVTARWLRFDVTARFGGERSELLVGTAVRF
jgi:long-subunit fatty acid transport protein